MVLAVSNESQDLVAPYVKKFGIPFAVGSGSKTGSALGKLVGARGIPHSYLINPVGRMVWHGHPSSLKSSHIEAALKGAKRPGPNDVLAWRGEVNGASAKALKAAAAGDLGAAFKWVEKGATPEGAMDLRHILNAHVDDLRRQIDRAIERRDLLVSLPALELLAKQMKKEACFGEITARLKEIEQDEQIQHELKAAEALERALAVVAKRGLNKARNNLASVAERYAGTRAGERAQAMLGSD